MRDMVLILNFDDACTRAIARGLLVEFCLQERQIPGGVFGDRVVDDRLDARRKSVLHTVGNVRAEPRGRQHG